MITEYRLLTPRFRSKQPSQPLWLSLYTREKELLGLIALWPYDTTVAGEDLAVPWLHIGLGFLPKVNPGRQAGRSHGKPQLVPQ